MGARGETAGVAFSALVHAALVALLSVVLVAPRVAPRALPPAVDVSLVTDIGLTQAAPAPREPPAASTAPETGAREEAPAAASRAEPARPSPPRPAAAPRDAPARPERPAARDLAALLPKLAPSAQGSADSAKDHRTRGARLSPDIVAGLTDKPSSAKTIAAPGAVVDAKALAGIVDAIRRQIQPCADRAVNPGPGANRIVTVLNLRLDPDGVLQSTPSVVRQSGIDEENGRYARRVIDLGIAAFKGCAPLKLPPEFYRTPSGGWYNINYNWQLR